MIEDLLHAGLADVGDGEFTEMPIARDRWPSLAVPSLGVFRSSGEQFVALRSLMRHLPKKGSREVIGDDAAEGVEDLVAVFGG